MTLSPRLVLLAYYEALHEHLLNRRDALLGLARGLLEREIEKQFSPITPDRLTAYVGAVAAFLDERIEMYNPIGAQYTIGQADSVDAFELQLELEWYDAREEYAQLIRAARDLIAPDMTDSDLPFLARKLIDLRGAWPDQSIIAAYTADPILNHLPDYTVACLIEANLFK